jgi:hypothetical protein
MDKTQIILISAVMAFLAVRLYQKYVKKDKGNSGSVKKPSTGSDFSSTSKDDDYEPYSKR